MTDGGVMPGNRAVLSICLALFLVCIRMGAAVADNTVWELDPGPDPALRNGLFTVVKGVAASQGVTFKLGQSQI